MSKHFFIFGLMCIIGSIYHFEFFHLNEVLKVADSFAYLQMSHFLGEFSQQGLGNGWFGFVYSFLIACVDLFFDHDFFSAKIANIILLNISAFLIYIISLQFLQKKFALFTVILWFLSPTFLHFNIHVLSENIYIPLFLGLFYITLNFVRTSSYKSSSYTSAVAAAILIGLMYLTRAEAFIYIGSIGLISIGLLSLKKISLKHFFLLGSIFFLSFFLFISPYLFHLHSLTGEWGLTNKGASNLRQAQLRGQEKMDDAGFEQAVAELTTDKTQLIAGFAGGMEYIKPRIEGSLITFIQEDPRGFFIRIGKNYSKLFSRNIPEIFLGKSPELYFSDDARFSHIYFLIFALLPLAVLGYGLVICAQKEKAFLYVLLSFFIPAMVFFTLFFTLNRYFLIFLPLLLIIFSRGIQEIILSQKLYFQLGGYILAVNLLLVYLLSTSVYYHIESSKDNYYLLKKEAGEWLATHTGTDNTIKIMERFPIVTYYAGSTTRYITPYTQNIHDILQYARHNHLDILVVDTMDFLTYRPQLGEYLTQTPDGFSKLQEFSNTKGQKVILYTVQK